APGGGEELVPPLHVVDVVDSLAYLDRGQLLPIVSCVQHPHAARTGDEKEVQAGVDRQASGSIRPALGQPGLRDLPALHVDGEGAVLVLEVGVEDAASLVDRVALGLPLEADLRL